MELILKEDVEKLGKAGQHVKVKGGYGRNYLLPQGLAIAATSGNLKVIEQHMVVRSKRLAALKADAEAQAAELNKLHLVFVRKVGEEGKLFGSVTVSDIAKELINNRHFQLDKHKIHLDVVLKQVGEHKVQIKLHPEVVAEITVEVKAEAEEKALVEEAKTEDQPEAAE
ncbi:MAG: 50S ribosomal protein L9 [Nitrospinae bacterium]|nr:50S ribosomal protein L9 [Nitrospinota bacterium]